MSFRSAIGTIAARSFPRRVRTIGSPFPYTIRLTASEIYLRAAVIVILALLLPSSVVLIAQLTHYAFRGGLSSQHHPIPPDGQDPVFHSFHRYGHRSVLPVERIFIRLEHLPCRRAPKRESPRKGASLHG